MRPKAKMQTTEHMRLNQIIALPINDAVLPSEDDVMSLLVGADSCAEDGELYLAKQVLHIDDISVACSTLHIVQMAITFPDLG
jgi:hypothetical protein